MHQNEHGVLTLLACSAARYYEYIIKSHDMLFAFLKALSNLSSAKNYINFLQCSLMTANFEMHACQIKTVEQQIMAKV